MPNRVRQGNTGHFCVLVYNILVEKNVNYFVVPYDSLYCSLTQFFWRKWKKVFKHFLKIFFKKYFLAGNIVIVRVISDSRRALLDSVAYSRTNPATTFKIGINRLYLLANLKMFSFLKCFFQKKSNNLIYM